MCIMCICLQACKYRNATLTQYMDLISRVVESKALGGANNVIYIPKLRYVCSCNGLLGRGVFEFLTPFQLRVGESGTNLMVELHSS